MPRRLPRAVKERRGTLQKCRDNPAAPVAQLGAVPPPPRGLTATEKRIWRELAPQIEALKVYSVSDFTSLRLTVKVLARIEDAHLEDPPMPATALTRLITSAAGLLGKFGLNPADRDRAAAIKAPLDFDEAFIFGRGLKAVE